MSFGEEEYRDQLYTEQQSKVLVLLPVLPGFLSVLGSCTILYIVLWDWQRKSRRLYHRLLLLYSAIDVVCSTNFALSAALVPRGTPGTWGAAGTRSTCQASGFISQFTFSLGLYATFICVHYVLILRYNVTERFLAKRVEPVVHFVALLTPLVTGIVMLLKGNYNPANAIIGWCFINVYPMDCLRRDEIECQRGEGYFVWMAMHNLSFVIFFVIVTVSCILTYSKVRDVTNRGTRWSLTQSRQSQRRIKETRIQAFLYIAAFFATYVFVEISTLLAPTPATKQHRNFYFPVVALMKIFLPLQGFWNCFIYIRPRYAAIRLRHPDMPLRRVLSIVLHSTENENVIFSSPNYSFPSLPWGRWRSFNSWTPKQRDPTNASPDIAQAKRNACDEFIPSDDPDEPQECVSNDSSKILHKESLSGNSSKGAPVDSSGDSAKDAPIQSSSDSSKGAPSDSSSRNSSRGAPSESSGTDKAATATSK